MALCEGRVCIVTGAGRGIGRQHALTLASHGAKVVVNDLGVSLDGAAETTSPAQAVADEIAAVGGSACVSTDDIATWDGAHRLIDGAIDAFGRVDVLVNNAGIVRDRMLVNMEESEWDDVIRVHLKGSFLPTRVAAAHWRELARGGGPVEASIVNTTSASGIYGNVGQINYGAAKAGIAAMTIIAARELDRYGVRVNAVAPGARTRMTATLPGFAGEEGDQMSPEWVSSVVAWLASTDSAGVTGRVIEASGLGLAVAEGWKRGPSTAPVGDPNLIDGALRPLIERAQPNALIDGTIPLAFSASDGL